jgi:Ca2+-binding RTX toxin-like protein
MANFTAYEQYMLELINRARMDPNAEAKRQGVSLNEGVDSKHHILSSAKEVLAGNDQLGLAAEKHSQWILTNDKLDHFEAVGSPAFYGNSPFDRMTTAGYPWAAAGENIGYVGGGALNLTSSIADIHKNFFVDANTTGRGHRTNIMSESYREVGIGHEAGTFGSVNASVITEDFGTRIGTIFITGVVYNDTVKNDDFFSIGEQVAGRTVRSTEAIDSTGDGGGYELEYKSLGTRTVTFELATGDVSALVAVNKTNVKLDVVNGNQLWTNGTVASLSTNVKELHALGTTKVKLTGSDAKEKIFGNGEDNKLTGNGGKDAISGGGGDDKIIGGAGKDTMTGGANNDKFIFKAEADSLASKPDIIKDFGDSGKDKIDLHALGDLTYRDELKINGAMQVNVTKDGSDVIVHINLDADKADEMRIVLDHTSLGSMDKGDFIL